MWMLLSLAMADPSPGETVEGTFKPNFTACDGTIDQATSKLLGRGAGATTHGHVLLTSSEQLARYKQAMHQDSNMSVIPAAGLPHNRLDTLSVLALVPGARNGPTGWTIGGQPVQVYIDGARISTHHSFF